MKVLKQEFFSEHVFFFSSSGHYKAEKSRSLCEECNDGYYQTKKGQTGCIECPKGYFCPVSKDQEILTRFFKICRAAIHGDIKNMLLAEKSAHLASSSNAD